jgi:hypothetical protein
MKMLTLIWAVFAGFGLVALADEKSPRDGTQKKAAPKSKSSRQESLTGCVDEQDGKYVLLDDKMLKKVANLETAIASSEDVFAKHLGHKVIVKGSRVPEQEAVFKVASIEDVAAVCAPAQGANPQ